MTGQPIVLGRGIRELKLVTEQVFLRRNGKIFWESDFWRQRIAVRYLEDPAVGSVMPIGVVGMALVLVIPIDHINAAVGSGFEVDDLRPGIVEIDEVGRVMADE